VFFQVLTNGERLEGLEVKMRNVEECVGALELAESRTHALAVGLVQGDRMGALEVSLSGLEARMGALEVSFEGLEGRMSALPLEVSLEGLEGRMGALHEGLRGVEMRMRNLEVRFDKVFPFGVLWTQKYFPSVCCGVAGL